MEYIWKYAECDVRDFHNHVAEDLGIRVYEAVSVGEFLRNLCNSTTSVNKMCYNL